MSDVILDASAVLAFLQKERGHEKVDHALAHASCHMSAMNYIEALGRLIDTGASPQEADDDLQLLGISIAPFDVPAAQATSALRPLTQPHGLSLGDRACLALAAALATAHSPPQVYTTDTQWAKVRLAGSKFTIVVLR